MSEINISQKKVDPMELDAYIETDQDNPDFGRVKDVKLAHQLASQLDAHVAYKMSDNPNLKPQDIVNIEKERGDLDAHVMAGVAKRIIEASGVELPNDDWTTHNIAAYYSKDLDALTGEELKKDEERNPLKPTTEEQLDLKVALSDANSDYYSLVNKKKSK